MIVIALLGSALTVLCISAEPLIQPLEPITPASSPAQVHGSRRIEDFLHDCFRHPLLQVPLEISLSSTPLKKVLQIIADVAQLSLVVDDAVSGVVPFLMVRGEPVGNVLHTLLTGRSPPLGVLIVEKVLHVAPKAVLMKRARQLLFSAYEPPVHKTCIVNWLAWNEQLKLRLEAMWQQCLKQHSGAQRTQYFFTDDESRRVLVQGTSAQVALFCRMLTALDVAVPQIKIEARIVVARTDFMTRFGLTTKLLFREQGGLTLASSGASLELPFVFGGRSLTMNALNLVLNAAEHKNLVRTLLAPQIMSFSGRKAVLHEGYSVPIESYTEDAVEGRTRTMRSAQYRDVGVKIQLKPHVMPDGKRVKLDLLVENSHLASASANANYPTITTSKVQNTVILNDGQTVLLGGLTQNEHLKESSGTPWLAKIPLLGWLFSSKGDSRQERRLYLFLHARLLPFEFVPSQ